MTITLFLTLFTIGSCVSAVFTESVKKAYQNAGKNYSSNVLALIDAGAVGGAGTAAAYLFFDIPWTVQNILCLIMMIFCVWMASMTSYDKVIQLMEQIARIKKD